MIQSKSESMKEDVANKYWFKRKLYGWGWTPSGWQGWLIISIYILLVAAFAFTIDETSPPKEIVFTCLLPITLLTVSLIRICYAKGEKPKWQWGPEDDK